MLNDIISNTDKQKQLSDSLGLEAERRNKLWLINAKQKQEVQVQEQESQEPSLLDQILTDGKNGAGRVSKRTR